MAKKSIFPIVVETGAKPPLPVEEIMPFLENRYA